MSVNVSYELWLDLHSCLHVHHSLSCVLFCLKPVLLFILLVQLVSSAFLVHTCPCSTWMLTQVFINVHLVWSLWLTVLCLVHGSHIWKALEFFVKFPGPGKSWKIRGIYVGQDIGKPESVTLLSVCRCDMCTVLYLTCQCARTLIHQPFSHKCLPHSNLALLLDTV